MHDGIIIKALSGFYYVMTPEGLFTCRARGKFRLDGASPLVGDRVEMEATGPDSGYIGRLCERKNFFLRPAVANVDCLVLLAANVNPVTDPFLLDRVAVIAEHTGCGCVICINKCDLDRGDRLFDIYSGTGYPVVRTSAVTGEGLAELRELLSGKTAVLTGDSGVGKSSLLNLLCPEASARTDEVSRALGRGKHTTRHVELYDAGEGTYIADTPGFASFDPQQLAALTKEELQLCFPEFREYLGRCRFDDCAHLREPGCAVLQAVEAGQIDVSRHRSYERLYEMTARLKSWEQK